MIENGCKYLITTDNWFIAPDGEQYRAVYGVCYVMNTKEALGFNPTHSTNWFVKVGDLSSEHIIIGGCQIHYAVRLEIKPKKVEGTYVDKNTDLTSLINKIYFPPEVLFKV